MNYTDKYHLPQWEENDRIMRTDFNEAMANVENGMTDISTSFSAGHYMGLDRPQKIVTGFRPKVVMIHGYKAPSQSTEDFSALSAVFYSDRDASFLKFEDDGFTVTGTSLRYPLVNRIYQDYVYFAFR